jgi:hypothetical protein
LITLPVAALVASDVSETVRRLLLNSYLCLFGLTHFWVTFAVYLNAENLDHFRESLRNRVVYFYAPAAIFLSFAIMFGTGLASAFPQAALLVLVLVRFINYRHLTRQAYGVSRMLWHKPSLSAGGDLARAEQGFLSVLTMLMFLTELYGGRFTIAPIAMKMALMLAAILGVWTTVEYAKAVAATPRRAAAVVPATYLLLQVFSIALAVYRTDFYVATLAMHYVEYHILMAPRCFRSSIDVSRQPDRFFAALRQRPAALYASLVTLSLAFLVAQKASLAHLGTMVPHMFDSLFVFHFFIECFVWKMGVPHYRHTLAPLYFAPRSRSNRSEQHGFNPDSVRLDALP